jgi:membrane-bound lytic murein transglycosylase D
MAPALLALALSVLVSGCASRSASAVSAPPRRDPVAVVPDTSFLSTEEASGAAEYIRLVRESMKDGSWYEATGYIDSAMAELALLETAGDLNESQMASVHAWQDTVRGWMSQAAGQSERLGGAENVSEYIDQEIDEVSLASLEDLEALIPRLPDRNFEIALPSPIPHEVLQAMRVFTGSGREYFDRWLRRRGRYEALIRGKLQERGLPSDLLYLSMIESGFNPKAWSNASASGLWQFIRGTGRRYGLQDDWWEDARRDPVRATDAALDYLEDLYAEFGDWHLAMAAYNCGEGRVRRQLRQEGAQSYWGMSLPKETRYYVPKILAAMIIGRNPAVFGFGAAADSAHAPLRLDTLTITRAMPLRGIASVLGIPEDSVKAINPALRRWSTPPGRASYVLYLPEGSRDSFLAGLSRIDTVPAVSTRTYRVARGQTLSGIAARNGVSVAALQAANGLRGTRVRAGQVLTIPGSGGSEEFDVADGDGPEEQAAPVIASRHTVRSGETLSRIAARYHVAISGLRRANNMEPGDVLKVGRVLSIPRGRSIVDAGDEVVARAGSTRREHVVRRGETLSAIAVRYGVRTNDLKAWNLLRGNNVRVGQRLVVHVPPRVAVSLGLEYYNVRRGDNLWAISSRFGSTIHELRRMNEGLSEDLQPGQRIRVR